MSDPAAGTFEFPGGHLEGNETPRQAAVREWQEETGLPFPDGDFTGAWTSPNGIYQGFVYTVAHEADLNIFERDWLSNPDDPDGDAVEAIAWWDPAQLPGNPSVRQELLDNLDAVLAAIDGVAEVEKTATVPKGDASDMEASTDWPGWSLDERTADHWAAQLRDAMTGVLGGTAAQALAGDYLAAHQPPGDDEKPDKAQLTEAAVAWLAIRSLDFETPVAVLLPAIYTDGYLIGLTAAHATVDQTRPQLGGWTAGDTESARRQVDEAGGGSDLDELLNGATRTAQQIADTRRRDIARELVNGLLIGATIAALGKAITSTLGRLDTAVTIALTEITRSSGLAALFGYQQLGVSRVQWLIDPSGNVCPRCLANAGAGPVALGTTFPSGDRSVPAHPRCRCAVVPA
ncbi:NUDIX hydrolase [Streptacidiphilus sp. PAMC 29251]